METANYSSKRFMPTRMSPVVLRLEPKKKYISPWRFIPKSHIGQSKNIEDKTFLDLRKRQIKLELPKIVTETQEKTSCPYYDKSTRVIKDQIKQINGTSIYTLIENFSIRRKRSLSPYRMKKHSLVF
ncbi:hypothetical protein SteCoe_8166 [Stentor coeruleus]|uniref:Uncharacterized protein n=1 Tax=Stentor coeruleus TaxID=5963 RepID=A0A1R2CKT9_9CILI|nr:hypothetical protein SteCoe_8166 [Stentor coeruleus]